MSAVAAQTVSESGRLIQSGRPNVQSDRANLAESNGNPSFGVAAKGVLIGDGPAGRKKPRKSAGSESKFFDIRLDAFRTRYRTELNAYAWETITVWKSQGLTPNECLAAMRRSASVLAREASWGDVAAVITIKAFAAGWKPGSGD